MVYICTCTCTCSGDLPVHSGVSINVFLLSVSSLVKEESGDGDVVMES